MAADPGPGLRARRAAVLEDPGLAGGALAAALAATTDTWLRSVFAAAAGPAVTDVALLAVGGYGRGELAPGSDLDLVLVHRNRRDIGRIAEAVWYPVWDEGVALDHSVRTARELGSAMDDDLRVALGLLDARTVAGSVALGDETRQACLGKWQARAKRWLPELDLLVRARHRECGDLAFLLEPDLKEARGGLRDLHLLVGLAQVVPILDDLVAGGRLSGPGAVLTAVRVELQRGQTRERNRLNLQDQDRVAAALGSDADRLMAGVADAARAVAWAGDDAWRRIERMLGGRRRRRQWTPEPLEPGIVLRGGEITLAYGADPADDPALALRLAAVSAELDIPMARDTIDSLSRSAPPPPGGWTGDLYQALLRLLGAGRPAIPAWETLDQQGAMVRLLPEWAAVRNRPQRNAYHRFTVDRHLLETAANASALARRVARPDLLLLGALVHDIGKGLPGDHTDAGVGVVTGLAPRLGLDGADTAVLVDMVRLHLLLPEVATRRDLSDAVTIDSVARAVGDRDRLELLAALTEADSLATGPAAWGAWKAGLVASLVHRVGLVLDGHPPPSPPPVTPEQRRLLALGRLTVVVDGTEVTVAAPDRPGLLATVAGVLAVDGAAIRSASARSDPAPQDPEDGPPTALFVLQVAPTRDVLPEATRLERDLGAALAGELSIATRMAEREAQLPRRRPTAAGEDRAEVVVCVDHLASAQAAMVEVRAPDRLGTLWRMAGALEETGLVIATAVVATLGAEVVDTFYLRTPGGDKPPAGDRRLEDIPGAIRRALASGAGSGT